MSSPDIHTLTGAYALDALNELERRQFQAHLSRCPDCAREVDELRATAAKLGVAAAQQPPQTLRATVMAQVAATRQDSPIAGPADDRDAQPRRPGHPRWRTRLTASAAVLAAAAALVLGAVSVHIGHELDSAHAQLVQLAAQYAPVARLAAAPDAKGGSGPGVRGGTAFVLASHQLDEAVLLVSGLPSPAPGHTYQAWLIGHGHPRSVGLLNTGTARSTTSLRFDGLDGVAKVGLTIEPAGGSAQPTTTPVVLFDLPT